MWQVWCTWWKAIPIFLRYDILGKNKKQAAVEIIISLWLVPKELEFKGLRYRLDWTSWGSLRSEITCFELCSITVYFLHLTECIYPLRATFFLGTLFCFAYPIYALCVSGHCQDINHIVCNFLTEEFPTIPPELLEHSSYFFIISPTVASGFVSGTKLVLNKTLLNDWVNTWNILQQIV